VKFKEFKLGLGLPVAGRGPWHGPVTNSLRHSAAGTTTTYFLPVMVAQSRGAALAVAAPDSPDLAFLLHRDTGSRCRSKGRAATKLCGTVLCASATVTVWDATRRVPVGSAKSD